MATWCILNGLKQKLKYGPNILGTTQSILMRGARTGEKTLTTNSCYCSITLDNDTVQKRFIHSSVTCYGKRTPKGTPLQLNPLKVNKNKKNIIGRAFVHEQMTIKELAIALKKPLDHVYEVLMFIPDTNKFDHDEAVLDKATMIEIVRRSGMVPEFRTKKVKQDSIVEDKDAKRQPPPDPSVLVRRPPVVTIMGHVDHGKTTLLDQLRESNIVDTEFGGITQHIGAFQVKLDSGETICFLDTPGHAAFSAMRSRGAQLTDIVVLVVAADDGVMQQTEESIQHAKQARVPIVVAINKIDKSNADVGRTKQMLLEHQIQLEEFGGDIQAVPVSALQGTNLLELQEAIVTQAELMNLTGDPQGQVEGRVVEARVDQRRGRLVTAVIQRGTLKRGDLLIAGPAAAKVRAMFDDSGQPVQVASPGTPVEILGWRHEIPSAGQEILQLQTESEVKSVLAWRHNQAMHRKQEEDSVVIQEKREEYHQGYHAKLVARREQGYRRMRRKDITRPVQDEEKGPQFSLILKGDVDGSVEAILDSLDTYRSSKCQLDIIHYGVGNVTESDIEMADAFEGIVYAFNVEVPSKVKALANTKGVLVKQHNIIYRLFEDLKEGINHKLPKLQEDVVHGEAKVLQVFQVTLPNKKKTWIAGCRCIMGNLSKKYGIKISRNDEIVYKGSMVTLKHFKEDVQNVKKEQECGICIDDPDLIFEPQDVIICYDVKEINQEIDWDPGF